MQRYSGFRNAKIKTDMSVFSVIENEFDNFDNYNLNLLLIKRIILRGRKLGSPHAHMMNSNPSQSTEKFTRKTRIKPVPSFSSVILLSMVI